MAIKWLNGKRNLRGGFSSTQDTVIGMQALSDYSKNIPSDANVKVLVNYSGNKKKEFTIDENNKLLLQEQKLNATSTENTSVSFTTKGKGCFLVQSVLKYNTVNTTETSNFDLTAEASKKEIKICAKYTGSKKKTDMVLIEAEVLTGYQISEESIEVHLNEIDSNLEKYELNEEKDKFTLYFDEMSKELQCWKFEHKKVRDVEKLQPAIVKVYDYYAREDTVATKYIVD